MVALDNTEVDMATDNSLAGNAVDTEVDSMACTLVDMEVDKSLAC